MNQTINIGIASLASRESSLQKVIESLHTQADNIFIVLNGYTECPKFLWDYPNVMATIGDNVHGANAKFTMAEHCTGYYFSCDDDLIYPDGYVAYLKAGVDKYDALVSLHGKKYLRPVTDFRNWAGNYRCLNTVSEDVQVDVVGSGVCAFHTDRLKIRMDAFKKKNMSDLYLSKQAKEQEVSMVVLKHTKDYLTYLPQKDTIWRSIDNFQERTEVLKSFVK
jgi:hypothetical protein